MSSSQATTSEREPNAPSATARASTYRAYAATSPSAALQPFSIARRDVGPRDIQIDILFCGVCHSDLHQARNEWQGTIYPCVPGHEIVGRVVRVGGDVTRFRKVTWPASGAWSTRAGRAPAAAKAWSNTASRVHADLQQPRSAHGRATYGGYSESIVVDEAFTLRIPDRLDLAAAAPLLCAGITTYSPLRHWRVRKGQKVGIVGLGGLGHMGVKFATPSAPTSSLFTTSPDKTDDGLRLGANEVVVSKNPDAMATHATASTSSSTPSRPSTTSTPTCPARSATAR